MPADFPPWDRACAFFRHRRGHGLVKELHDRLRARVREREGRDAEPAAAVIDSRSVKADAVAGSDSRDSDGGKLIDGRGRHVVVDTPGLLLEVMVTAADTGDRTAARVLLRQVADAHHRLAFAAAARLSCRCAFACFDDELHGRAQRYYLASAQLAAQADDPVQYAIALRGLSVQAQSRGCHRRAVHLAEQALRTAARHAPDQTRAFLYGQLAAARAQAGEHRAAVADLACAERLLERTTSRSTPVAGYHQGALALNRAALAGACGDTRLAVSSLRFAVRRRPAHEHRSRAVARIQLGEQLWLLGRRGEAVDTWLALPGDCAQISSGRVAHRLAQALTLTRHHRDDRITRLRLTLAPCMVRPR